jgi:7-carboxy-7-deazaguanine synthase
MSQNKLPIAEVFHSIQGEGAWVGTPMLFIRTAGCNVGTSPNRGYCTLYDGRMFLCDTDYRKNHEASLADILESDDTWEHHICITGGEPFLHDLSAVRDFCDVKAFHIETSGTILFPEWARSWVYYVACSPKKGFVPENREWIQEWKFLVDRDFSEEVALEIIGNSTAPVYLQPVNGFETLCHKHLDQCMEVLRHHPQWRLSVQLHKLLGVR